MPSIHVELDENSYPIFIEHGHLGQIGGLLKPRAKSPKAIVVADALFQIDLSVSGSSATAVFISIYPIVITTIPIPIPIRFCLPHGISHETGGFSLRLEERRPLRSRAARVWRLAMFLFCRAINDVQ